MPELKPDYYSDIFHSVHQVMHELVLVENPHPEAPPDANKIYMHWKTKRIPAFLHFNGAMPAGPRSAAPRLGGKALFASA